MYCQVFLTFSHFVLLFIYFFVLFSLSISYLVWSVIKSVVKDVANAFVSCSAPRLTADPLSKAAAVVALVLMRITSNYLKLNVNEIRLKKKPEKEIQVQAYSLQPSIFYFGPLSAVAKELLVEKPTIIYIYIS